MYRTIYSTKLNAWVIQLLWMNTLWVTIKDFPFNAPAMFQSLDDAEVFIKETGLDRQYRRHNPSHYTDFPDSTGEIQPPIVRH